MPSGSQLHENQIFIIFNLKPSFMREFVKENHDAAPFRWTCVIKKWADNGINYKVKAPECSSVFGVWL